jgi:hypothetical protein
MFQIGDRRLQIADYGLQFIHTFTDRAYIS